MGDCMRHTARVLIIGEVSATLKEVIDDIEGGNVSKVIVVDKGDGVDGEMKSELMVFSQGKSDVNSS
ncbi:hypothetical protein GYH30_000163 [Glycine max]|nr:hypothetical protein GYH30_000163 [Glycine max]